MSGAELGAMGGEQWESLFMELRKRLDSRWGAIESPAPATFCHAGLPSSGRRWRTAF
jgi:hypothetical protein